MLYRAMRLADRRDQIPVAYTRQVAQVKARWHNHLQVIPRYANSQRLRRRFIKHEQDTFVFLERDDVPATNNASEQALRNSVIRRKVTGGFRTLWGATAYMNMVSILESARRQGLNLFRTLGKAITSQPAFTPQGE